MQYILPWTLYPRGYRSHLLFLFDSIGNKDNYKEQKFVTHDSYPKQDF